MLNAIEHLLNNNGSMIWNCVSNKIQIAPSVEAFKYAYKKIHL